MGLFCSEVLQDQVPAGGKAGMAKAGVNSKNAARWPQKVKVFVLFAESFDPSPLLPQRFNILSNSNEAKCADHHP